MNTTLSSSTTHPPDTEGRQVLEIPAPSELRKLGLADRLSLKIGVWLLRRAQRPQRPPLTSTDVLLIREEQLRHEREMALRLSYELYRQPR